MTTKASLITKLQKKYPKMTIFRDGNGWVSKSPNIFSVSAEDSGIMSSDGYDLLNYWTQNYEFWEFGVHLELVNFLRDHGWYAEWVNPGVLAIVKDI
jgi:hypothetical protein